jgi:hypothetical protein
MTKDQLVVELNKHADIVNLGTPADSPSEDWIFSAEQSLGVSLPDEYKWFLRQFGGGEICGEEIYSIYGLPFEEAVGGDVVYQNTIANDNLVDGKVVLSNTDFGEEFYFKIDDLGPIFLSVGSSEERYATDFIDYIDKRLKSYTKG